MSPIVSESILGLSLKERKELQRQAREEDNRKWAVELDMRNRAKSGNTTFGAPVNSLLPNAIGAIMKPSKTEAVHKIPSSGKPNSVVDCVMRKGGISRVVYDEEGRISVVIDNNDHGNPKRHPFGSGGAHYVVWRYDDEGTGHRSEDYCLTAKMRRLCKDIIESQTNVTKTKEPVTMFVYEDDPLTIEDFIDILENGKGEVEFDDRDGNHYLASGTVRGIPDGKKFILCSPDDEQFTNTAEEILDLFIKTGQIRAIFDELEF